MLSSRWRKVLRDLSHNKTRSVLVVLSIAIGVFAVGMIIHTSLLVTRQVREDYLLARAANFTVYAQDVDDTMVDVIRRMPGVEDAQGRTTISVQVDIGDDTWRQMMLRAYDDLEDIRIDRVLPVYVFDPDPEVGAERGVWPPQEQELALERSSFLLAGMLPAGLEVGEEITVQTADGKRRQLRLSGLAHESNGIPATFMGQAIGYIGFDTLEWLGGEREYGEVKVVVEGDASGEEQILPVAREVEDKIERSGREVGAVEIHEPGRTPRDSILEGLIAVMFVLGLLSLLLSSFLIVNTIAALLSQHVRQIGMMKAVGARNRQIFAMYMFFVFVLCFLALALAVPLAALATTQTVDLLAGFLNSTFPPYSIPLEVLAVEVTIGLVIPMLAALIPIASGTRITVREAITSYGVGKGRFGTRFLDRLLGRIRFLSRPMALSLRNTFRRRARLAMTLFTLILGGAIFIAVVNVRGSMTRTLDDVLRYWQFDGAVAFANSYRLEQIEQIAYGVPGVSAVESWNITIQRRQRPDGSESDNIMVSALPPDTVMLQPILIHGRWLLPEDQNAIVVNQEVLKNEADVGLGDTLTIEIGGRDTDWQIVGVVQVIGAQNWAYVSYEYFSEVAHETDKASQVQVVTTEHDGESVDAVVKMLVDAYKAAGMDVTATQTVPQIREQNEIYFNIIAVLLLVMSILIATVGALGLAGTMGINVMERTREIGVMRAIGASNGIIRRIVIVEGILIGLISWGLGALLAFPLGRIMSEGVGSAIFGLPLSYAFSPAGIFFWLGIVLVCSALASFFPARRASRLTVRETLAYE